MFDFIIEHNETINLLASIGAFISGIIAIYTLVEVKKQRLSTYKPELLLKSFLVSIHKSPLCLDPGEILLFKTQNFNEYLVNDNKQEFSTYPKYKIENLGFGIAKNIKIIWDFNMQKALEILKTEMSEDYYFDQYKPLQYYFLSKKSDPQFQFSFINNNKTTQTTDYIAPINVKEHTHYHSIPTDITTIHFLYFIFKNNLTNEINENNYSMELNDLPQIEMKVQYYDLNNKKYTRKYKFKTSITTTQIEDELDMKKEFGYLLFELE